MKLGKNEPEKLDGDLVSTLKEYVRFLASSEKSFGHATALSKYGRQFFPASRAPEWLQVGPSGTCFRNAAVYALEREDVDYAEGYAIDPMLPAPIYHAWLVTSAGHVLDPTWRDVDDHVYFGIAFERNFVVDMLGINSNEPGILVNLKPLTRLLRSRLDIEQAIEAGRVRPNAG